MIKIVQYYVGNDPEYLKLCDASITVNSKYAQAHGYKYSFQMVPEQKLINYYGSVTYQKIIAYKIKLIYDHLMMQDKDVVVFIDADAAVSKATMKIEDLLDDKHEIYLSRGNQKLLQAMLLINAKQKLNQLFSTTDVTNMYYEQIMKKYGFFFQFEWLSIGGLMLNGGFIVVKNTPLMRDLFADALSFQHLLMDTVYKSKTQDERALGLAILKGKYFDKYTFMYQQAQGGKFNSYGTKYDEEKTFILHNYGKATAMHEKIAAIYNLLNNKWWSQIIQESKQ